MIGPYHLILVAMALAAPIVCSHFPGCKEATVPIVGLSSAIIGWVAGITNSANRKEHHSEKTATKGQ